MKTLSLSALAACGALASFPAVAGDADLNALREEIAQMKQAYEQRIKALEKRLDDAEKQVVAASSTAEAAASQAQVAREASRQPAAANAFNPEISMILSGTYTNTSQDPRQDPTGVTGRERRIQGLLPSGGELAPDRRSFSIGESELAISANVDPHFRGTFLFSIAPDNTVSVEEANVQTLGLDNGLGIKAGRFFSGIGYENEQHPHTWDFSNAALPYQAFFGSQLGYDGIQMKWVAPTELFFELGVETGRALSFPAGDANGNKNGLTSGSLFAHVGGDAGVANSWRAGASYFNIKPRDRTYEDVDSTSARLINNSFSGKSNTTVLDFVWKWAPEGNAKERNFKFQSEWLRRRETGELTYDTGAGNRNLTDGFSSTQSGWYAQGVWQFMPAWRVGYRYDQLAAANTSIGLIENSTLAAADLPILQGYTPKRNTAMMDWSPSEFSRIRFQVARDQTRPGVNDNQVWLQYIMSLGAHGAHKF